MEVKYSAHARTQHSIAVVNVELEKFDLISLNASIVI